MKIKFKRLDKGAKDPIKFHVNDVGFDLTAISRTMDEFGNMVYGTGLALEIPPQHGGFLFPRSSVTKMTLDLANAVGVIDPDYRGEVIVKFKPAPYYASRDEDEKYEYEVGDRVVQLVILPIPQVTFEETETLEVTKRAEGGFGSTNLTS